MVNFIYGSSSKFVFHKKDVRRLCIKVLTFRSFQTFPTSTDDGQTSLMAFRTHYKMASTDILFMQKLCFSPHFLLHVVSLHQHAKSDENPPIDGVKMALWSTMAAVAILNFSQITCWSCDPIQGVILHQLPKFEPNPSNNSSHSYGYFFSKIQDGGRPQFWNCSDVN